MAKAGGWNDERKNGARSRHRTRTTVSWASAGADTLKTFIATLTESGSAVMFGRTSDGGALSLLVLAGNDKYREYITVASDILPTFQDVLEDLQLGELTIAKT